MASIDPKALLAGMRARLERDQAEGRLDGLTVEALANAMAHPKAPDVIAETLALDAQAVKEGEPAPDFTLPWLSEGSAGTGPALTLSAHFGRRPVALVFGSYT